MMKKQGFTLAEVLITLVIIGIIAAMTLPSLLGVSTKQEYKTALQKAVSVLSQAITLEYALNSRDFDSLNNTSDFANFVNERFNLKVAYKTSDSGVFSTADGIDFNMSNVITGGCSSEKPCQITVDVNGKKGPGKTTSSETIAEGTTPTFRDVNDQFTLWVHGTTVSAANTSCSKPEDLSTCSTHETIGSKLLDGSITK